MSKLSKMLGFDRQIKKEWLDVTIELLFEGKNAQHIREMQERFMALDLPGKDARRKTRLVISRMWLDNNTKLIPLRKRALEILKENPEIDTRVFHWGMSIATYPFFRDIATIIGKLIALQGNFKVSQVHDRIGKIWGGRSTLTRACSRVIQTMIMWEIIESTKESKSYNAVQKLRVAVRRKQVAQWLIYSLLLSRENGSVPVEEIGRSPELFPFSIEIGVDALLFSNGIKLSHRGIKTDFISLKENNT
ncbi:hypothetical protein Y696_00465 [Mesotoga sp. H07pep.5.4]|nr:hypothetical protein Y696_00465 [Mesotoga sp. H07pep.5.4]